MADPVAFFDTQFRRQVEAGEYALNPFEQAALPYLQGRVLDLGCGLGNLALEAGRRGCEVLALDASPTAIERINRAAEAEQLKVSARQADLETFAIGERYDTIVCIGLLMFFRRQRALGLLADIQAHVAVGGCVIVNVLVEGTTYLDMFREGHYTLFGRDELARAFAPWEVCLARQDEFDAPRGTRKVFATVIARKSRLS
jgi:tellurite methyltransferase